MENLIVGLVLAAVGGTAWLSYYQPYIFNYVAKGLIALDWVVFFGIVIYNFGLTNAQTAMLPFIATGKSMEAFQSLESYRPSFWVTVAATFGSMTYLVILGILSEHFVKEKPNSNQDQVNVDQNSSAKSKNDETY